VGDAVLTFSVDSGRPPRRARLPGVVLRSGTLVGHVERVMPAEVALLARHLRTLWSAGGTVLNGWLHLPDALAAEVMARAGWDSLTVDLQHGMSGDAAALSMLQAITGTAVVPLVRVPGLDPERIMRMLDWGFLGVICPMVETAAQARALVQACRYPPHGDRSFGPTRAALIYGPEYGAWADAEVLIFAMIETVRGLENLDEILATPGLSGIYVGPGDLGQTMGIGAKLDRDDADFLETLRDLAQRTTARGLIPGVFAVSPAYGHRMAGFGYRLITLSSDFRLLNTGARQSVNEFARLSAESPTKSR